MSMFVDINAAHSEKELDNGCVSILACHEERGGSIIRPCLIHVDIIRSEEKLDNGCVSKFARILLNLLLIYT